MKNVYTSLFATRMKLSAIAAFSFACYLIRALFIFGELHIMNRTRIRRVLRPPFLLFILFSFLLSASFGLSGCGLFSASAAFTKWSLPANTLVEHSVTQPQTELHVLAPNASLEYIAASGLIALYYDSVSSAVTVRDTQRETSFSALPQKKQDENDTEAAVVTLDIRDENTLYHLNSQDNSVSFSKHSHTVKDGALTVTYPFFVNEQTAKKTKPEPSDISFSVAVTYTLLDGNLYVSVSHQNLSGNPSAKIETLGLLEYFGAYAESVTNSTAESAKGEYLFVPDGCGALIHTDIKDEDFTPKTYRVYGDDAAIPGSADAYVAILPAYGIRRTFGAFVALIEQGDALAEIRSDRRREGNAFNRVGPRFRITPSAIEVNEKNATLYAAGGSYEGPIQLCLRFIGGSAASYNNMASAVREQLIRNKTLSTKKLTDDGALPFYLSVIGAAEKPLFRINRWDWSYTPTQALTTFEQTQILAQRLKGKGINALNIRCRDALAGGEGADIYSASPLRRLGGTDGYQALQTYTQAQNMRLFLDFGLLTRGKKPSLLDAANATSLSGKPVEVTLERSSALLLDAPFAQSRLRSVENVENAVIQALTRFRTLNPKALCVNDIGRLLYADYSVADSGAQGVDRQSAAAELAKQLASIATNRDLMVTGGNFYLLKTVFSILDLPLSAAGEISSAYTEIPFVQLILHGIIDYSATPLNYSKNRKTAMLRSLEYGACLSFEGCYTQTQDDTLCFESWIQEAADFYTQANTAFSGLRGESMVAHTQKSSGVFCTEYENGARLYINYNKKDTTADGFTVKAEHYLRVN